MLNISPVDTIVWDFDGVLNRNIINGEFIWQEGFEDEFGHSIDTFSDMIFNKDFRKVLIGEVGLLEVMTDWASTVGYMGDLRNVIEFWFQNDYNLDDRVMGLLNESKRANIRNVIGTNNEEMRTQFIAEDLGFSDRVERIFASGMIGAAKPDEDFYDMVSDELSVEPDEILLIDDSLENCEAAEASGWQAHWFDGEDYAGLEARVKEAVESGSV